MCAYIIVLSAARAVKPDVSDIKHVLSHRSKKTDSIFVTFNLNGMRFLAYTFVSTPARHIIVISATAFDINRADKEVLSNSSYPLKSGIEIGRNFFPLFGSNTPPFGLFLSLGGSFVNDVDKK